MSLQNTVLPTYLSGDGPLPLSINGKLQSQGFLLHPQPHQKSLEFQDQSAPHSTDFGGFYSLNLREKRRRRKNDKKEKPHTRTLTKSKMRNLEREGLGKRQFLKLESPMPQHWEMSIYFQSKKKTRRKKIRLYHQRFNLDTAAK